MPRRFDGASMRGRSGARSKLPPAGELVRLTDRRSVTQTASMHTKSCRRPKGCKAPIVAVGSPRPCKSDLIGKRVPGRRGGTVTACAVPPRDRPRARYVFVRPEGSLPGAGHAMRASNARRRIRNAAIELVSVDSAFLHDVHAEFRATRLPAPSGLEFPHARGSSRCDPEHGVWEGYQDARAEATERASIETEEGDDAAFLEALLRILSAHPRWASWVDAATKCAADFDARVEARAPKTMGAEYERAQLRKRLGNKVRRADERDTFGGDYLSEKLDATTENYKRKKGLPRSLRAKAHPKARKPSGR